MSPERGEWGPQDLGPEELWSHYLVIESAVRRVLGQGKDPDALESFTATVAEHEMHGLAAATAVTACSLFELASLEQRRPATIVALMSRVVPWRDPVGVVVHAILSAWVHRNHAQALAWIQLELAEGRCSAVARALGERLVFCLESAGLLSGMSAEERALAFAGRFFTALEADMHGRGRMDVAEGGGTYPAIGWPNFPGWSSSCRRWQRADGRVVWGWSGGRDLAPSTSSTANWRNCSAPVSVSDDSGKPARTIRGCLIIYCRRAPQARTSGGARGMSGTSSSTWLGGTWPVTWESAHMRPTPTEPSGTSTISQSGAL